MKKFTFLLLSLTLCFSLAFGSAVQAVRITVDGNEVNQVNANGEPVPELAGDLVPIRAVLNAMGYGIDYDEETGLISGGTFADPEFVFAPGEEGSVVVGGTTFVEADMLANVLPFTVEIDDEGIAYTNTFSEIPEGWYKIFYGGEYAQHLFGGYLTGSTLPENDVVETVINDDGTAEEVVKTPLQQILAMPLTVQLDCMNDEYSKYEDHQLWLIREVAPKRYAIINKATGLAADVNSWSRENEAPIIQYTYAGGTNQQFTFSAADEGYYISNVHSKLDIMNNLVMISMAHGGDFFPNANAVVQYSGRTPLTWTLELVEPYENVVNLANVETLDSTKLDEYIRRRFLDYFFNDADFSRRAKANAEIYLLQNHFMDTDIETKADLFMDIMAIPFTDLMDGTMYEKLTANYEIVSVEEKLEPRYDEDYNEIGEITYYVYTIAMECNSPEDIHTFTVETVDPDDEEHVRRVCEAIACFEPPIRKSLRHFYYTGENYGTWNAWDGEVWNNTGEKDSVDGMVNMFAHELGHVIDSYFTVGDDVWNRALNMDIVPTTGYGQNNRWEDFGEFSQLYLLSRGNEADIAAIEKAYPNRTKTYRAALYNLDNEYYVDYRDEYDEVTAPIGDTARVDDEMYYGIINAKNHGALTNNGGNLTVEEYTKAENQLWQIYVLDEQRVALYSEIDGNSLVIPTTMTDTSAEISDDSPTSFGVQFDFVGIIPDGSDISDRIGVTVAGIEVYKFVVSETGAILVCRDEQAVAAHNDTEMYEYWQLFPSGKIPGIGDFAIKSGNKYLLPYSEDNGAPLILSDSSENSLWHIYKLPNGIGYITNTANGLAIDISGVSMDEGAAALAYTLSRDPNQTWLVIENENGTVSFRAQHSGLYLAANEEGKAIQSTDKYEWTLEAAE